MYRVQAAYDYLFKALYAVLMLYANSLSLYKQNITAAISKSSLYLRSM